MRGICFAISRSDIQNHCDCGVGGAACQWVCCSHTSSAADRFFNAFVALSCLHLFCNFCSRLRFFDWLLRATAKCSAALSAVVAEPVLGPRVGDAQWHEEQRLYFKDPKQRWPPLRRRVAAATAEGLTTPPRTISSSNNVPRDVTQNSPHLASSTCGGATGVADALSWPAAATR